jgi:phosphotriesterase-related protein
MLHPDRERVASLLKLIQKGAGDRVVVSHDSVWCWRGTPIPKSITLAAAGAGNWHPLHFVRNIEPQLLEGGASAAQLRALLVDNPRRFFAGEKLPALA